MYESLVRFVFVINKGYIIITFLWTYASAIKANKLLNESQSGFRYEYCTSYSIFTLHSIIKHMKASRKMKLFFTFVDFSKTDIPLDDPATIRNLSKFFESY